LYAITNIRIGYLLTLTVAQVQNIREKLSELGHRQCLVLHGMTGSGKSCLAAAALDAKELVLGTFKVIVPVIL
jgi:DNA replication protein DnaC